jgi:hypothetical protein
MRPSLEAIPRSAAVLPLRMTIIARKRDGEVVPPRTKKNSPQLIPHMARPILVPSEAYREWERAARSELIRSGEFIRSTGDTALFWRACEPIGFPVNCRALIYRDRAVGDAVGYYQGLADFLEDAGVLENDRWIVSWDGSRMLKDAKNPRIEFELTLAGAAQLGLEEIA